MKYIQSNFVDNGKFTINFYENFDCAGNLFSPMGIMLALSLVQLGAVGQSDMILTKIFGQKYNLDTLKYWTKSFNNRILKTMTILFFDKILTINPEYKLMTNNLAIISKCRFDNPGNTLTKINRLIEKKTDATIKNAVIQSDMAITESAILVNIVYFKASWQYKFDPNKTFKSNFHHSQIDKVNMMCQTNDFNYFENSKLQLVELPYEEKDYVMGIILPKFYLEQDNLNYTPNNIPIISPHELNEFINNLQLETVQIYLPKFTQKRDYNIIPILEKLGLFNMFSKKSTDLNIIAKEVYFSKIIHQVCIIVDEIGMEPPIKNTDFISKEPIKKFCADHTFNYYVRHIPSNQFLIYGDYQG